jgi:hypothetical protein
MKNTACCAAVAALQAAACDAEIRQSKATMQPLTQKGPVVASAATTAAVTIKNAGTWLCSCSISGSSMNAQPPSSSGSPTCILLSCLFSLLWPTSSAATAAVPKGMEDSSTACS